MGLNFCVCLCEVYNCVFCVTVYTGLFQYKCVIACRRVRFPLYLCICNCMYVSVSSFVCVLVCGCVFVCFVSACIYTGFPK